MPPRTDKADAWMRLEAQVRFSIQIRQALFAGSGIRQEPGLDDAVLFALRNLQKSGRLDVRQITAVRILVRELHRLLLHPGQGQLDPESKPVALRRVSSAGLFVYCPQLDGDPEPDRGQLADGDDA